MKVFLAIILILFLSWNFIVNLLTFETVHKIYLKVDGKNPATQDSILFSQRIKEPGR